MIKKTILFIFGLIISGAALFLSFRNVPIAELRSYINNINFIYIGLSVLLVVAAFFLRAARWKIIMNSRLSLSYCFNAMMVGFMINCILPARAGEIVRPVLAGKSGMIGLPAAFASVAIERFFDIVVLLLLFVGLSHFIEFSDGITYSFGSYTLGRDLLESFVAGTVRLTVVLLILIAAIASGFPRKCLIRIVKSRICSISIFKLCCKSVIIRYIEKIISFFDGFASGMGNIRSLAIFFKIIFISISIWGVQILSYFIASKAVDNVHLNIFQMAFVMVVICFFIAIPSVPGFWGVWEAGGIFGMMALGVSKSDAACYNLVNHAVQMLPVIFIGFISSWLIGAGKEMLLNNTVIRSEQSCSSSGKS